MKTSRNVNNTNDSMAAKTEMTPNAKKSSIIKSTHEAQNKSMRQLFRKDT